MKKNLVRILSLLIILTMIIPIVQVDAGSSTYDIEANTLHSLGLFAGTNKGFELLKPATRAEAATILVRILGKEKEASNYDGVIPFNDVPTWAKKNVDYLYTNNLTQGISKDKFGANDLITGNDYATFILRALGYSDKDGDFQWSNAIEKAVDIGLIDSQESSMLGSKDKLLRGDLVLLSYNALFMKDKLSNEFLISKLIDEKAISVDQYKRAASLYKPIYIHLSSLGYDVEFKNEIVEEEKPDKNQSLTAIDIAKTFKPSIVYLETTLRDNSIIQGSGVIIDSSGLILTNEHVIHNAKEVNVKLFDGRTIKAKGYTAKDESLDLAIIKIDTSGKSLSPVKIGNSDNIINGEKIYAYGNPYGLDYTISEGIISSTNRTIEGYFGGSLIQMTAPISHGSSGGALINSKGELIGITTLVYKEAQNLNFAVPINQYTSLSKSNVNPFYIKPQKPKGRVIEEKHYGKDFNYIIGLNSGDMVYGGLYNSSDRDTFIVPIEETTKVSLVLAYSNELMGEHVVIDIYDENRNLITSSQYNRETKVCSILTTLTPGEYEIIVSQNSGDRYIWNNRNLYLLTIDF